MEGFFWLGSRPILFVGYCYYILNTGSGRITCVYTNYYEYDITCVLLPNRKTDNVLDGTLGERCRDFIVCSTWYMVLQGKV